MLNVLLDKNAIFRTLIFVLLSSFNLSLLIGKAEAQVKLATVFADSMVIQREQPINIWGTASENEQIAVVFKDETYYGQADKNGNWLIRLPSQSVATEQSLKVVGQNTLEIKNIAFGDVFLAGGQSNMGFKLKEVFSKFPNETNLSDYPDVRHFKVKRHYNFSGPQQDIEGGHWQTARAGTVGNFSAVAWFFAKDLYQKYKVPIGIISSSVGSTPADSWMSIESLKDFPDAQALAYKLGNDDYVKQLKNEYQQERQAWRKQNPNKKKIPFILMHRTSLDFKPTGFYNAMIAPLKSMKFAGVIWYQGESNARSPKNYAKQFTELISLWRDLFSQPKLPFMFVQIANFQMPDENPAESKWAELRAEQTHVANTVENTAMVLAIDAGERHNIHPLDKKTVGERLALAARNLIYGEKQLNYTSPLVDKAVVNNGLVTISFKHVNKGLLVKGDELFGFAIAAEDKEFTWANAKLESNKVTIWHDSIKAPKYVRYAWATNPENANLYNDQGLPATPFSIALKY